MIYHLLLLLMIKDEVYINAYWLSYVGHLVILDWLLIMNKLSAAEPLYLIRFFNNGILLWFILNNNTNPGVL